MRKKNFNENDFANFDKMICLELKKTKNKKKIEFITPIHTKIINLFNEYMDKPDKVEKGYHRQIIYKRAVLKSLAKACIERRAELLNQWKLLQGQSSMDDESTADTEINKTIHLTEDDKDGNT